MNLIYNAVLLLEFIFQGYCQYTYLSSLLNRKKNTGIVFCFFIIASCVEYLFYILLYNPIINIALVTILCFGVCILCFDAHWQVKLLHSCILSCMLVLCEILIIPFSNIFIHDNYFETHLRISELLISTLSKLVMFIICMIIKQIAQKEMIKTKSIWLFTVPVFTMILIHSLCILSGAVKDADKYNYVIIISFVSLIIINSVVFMVHESYVKTSKEAENLKLLEQKNRLDYEHYKLLQTEYNNSRLLVHDMKHHINAINTMIENNDKTEIKKYIGSLENQFSDLGRKILTGNKIIDIIIEQKWDICRKEKIEFLFSANNIDFKFMDEADICCVLSNLLDNAIESARKSKNKKIETVFYTNNKAIFFIEITNSCDVKPIIKNGKFLTDKNNKIHHGLGVFSVERILKKYSGYLLYAYDEENQLFKMTATIEKTV